MATPIRPTDPSVAEHLQKKPWDFQFFQAIRLLWTLTPKARLLSGFGEGLEEGVRFHSHLSNSFPASAIQDLRADKQEDGPLHMTVNFMGLTGPSGILPAFYTEYLMNRRAAGDETAIAFFDLFNHRLISLFYLAWEKYHFPIAYEREALTVRPRGFSQYLSDLIGMGTPGLAGRLEVDDTALIYYSGLIAQRPRSATALEGILRDFFQAPIEIEQFVGKWFQLEPENLSYLDAQGDYGKLGEGAIAGDQVWNQQAALRIRVGPLSAARFHQFLPGGETFRQFVSMVRYFVNESFDFELQLILKAKEVPECDLLYNTDSPRLGYSTWLRTGEFEADAQETVIAVRASEMQ